MHAGRPPPLRGLSARSQVDAAPQRCARGARGTRLPVTPTRTPVVMHRQQRRRLELTPSVDEAPEPARSPQLALQRDHQSEEDRPFEFFSFTKFALEKTRHTTRDLRASS